MDHWPIFVISLTDAASRRAGIAAQLEKLGLPFSFIDAVDGRKGLAPAYEDRIDRRKSVEVHGFPMSDGEFACALSHQSIYTRIEDEGLPGAIVLEDDAILTEDFQTFYRSRGYERAPLIQFFYFDARIWKVAAKKRGHIRILRTSAAPFAATGYSISNAAARRMRTLCPTLHARADWPCDTAAEIGHYVTVPRIVLHPPDLAEQSSLGQARDGTIPEGFDFTAGYAKGWRRLFSLASWRRLAARPFQTRLTPGFDPLPAERPV